MKKRKRKHEEKKALKRQKGRKWRKENERKRKE